MCKRAFLTTVVLLVLGAASASAQLDTLIHDDGMLINTWMFDSLLYYAVRFTPAGVCSVTAGFVWAYVPMGPIPPLCTLFVWDDFGGNPGPSPETFEVIGVMADVWQRWGLTPPYYEAAGNDFWIGYCTVYNPAQGRVYARSDALEDSLGRNWVSSDRTNWYQCRDTIAGWNGDLGIRAEVRYPTVVRDVGVNLIDEPHDTVACSDTIYPRVEVCNWGNVAESFEVRAEVDSAAFNIYWSVDTITALAPGNCTWATFGPWAVADAHGFLYDFRAFTILAADTIPGNDSLSKQPLAWCPALHDVGTFSVDEPPDTVTCGDTVPVAATVCNNGDTTETFDVEAVIDSGGVTVYADTQTVTNLASGICDTVNFTDWVVPPDHDVSYTVRVTTMLPTDVNPANDLAVKPSVAWCPAHDVGTFSVDEPPDTVTCGDSVSVAATVCNYGDTTETFDVEAAIDSGGVTVYADTQAVTGLLADSCTMVNFANWTVPPDHGVSYTVMVTTLLLDANPANDSATKGTTAWCPVSDVGAEAVLAPPDTVACDDSVLVAGRVCNYGDTTETFDVEAVIDSGGVTVYADTQAVTGLLADSCTTVNFANWTVPPDHGVSYTVMVTTLLLDANPANDSATKGTTAWCPAHDVGTASVLQPPDTVTCDDTVAVAAVVCNYGDVAETFDVGAMIDSGGVTVYADTQTVVDLSADTCTSVSFANWVVPPVHGVSYTVTVTTLLADDDPTNDTEAKGTTAWCPLHDVGAISIISPPDTVPCDSTYIPSVMVENYGDLAESFDVACYFDSSGNIVYGDTAAVTSLAPGVIDTVDFSPWTAGGLHLFDYIMTVTTLLGNDSNPNNDSLQKTVTTWCPGVEEYLSVPVAPSGPGLAQSRPNPARGWARIDYQLPANSEVSLRVYDLKGTVIRTLVSSVEDAGYRSAIWDGRDEKGREVASGVYFYKLQVLPEVGQKGFVATRKLILLR